VGRRVQALRPLSTPERAHYSAKMDSLDQMDSATALALLEWQVEMGVSDAILVDPVDRYALAAKAPKPAAPTKQSARAAPPQLPPEVDTVAVARQAAAGAADLAELQAAMDSYTHCSLRQGARNLVFSDGRADARVMIIGEAPARDEDQQGKPFVGQVGHLLDKMFDAIGMARDHSDAQSALYVTNVLPWRPPHDRDPKPEEVAMMLPFLTRHVELANPDVIILMGNHACRSALGKAGITRLRGAWTESFGKPTLPMFHPDYLLRTPAAKRDAWADLLALQARLLS